MILNKSQLDPPIVPITHQYLHDCIISSPDLEDEEDIHPPKNFHWKHIYLIISFDHLSNSRSSFDELPFCGEYHGYLSYSSSNSFLQPNEETSNLSFHKNAYGEQNDLLSGMDSQDYGEISSCNLYEHNSSHSSDDKKDTY